MSATARRRTAITGIALAAILIGTRWTLAPKYLFYLDNINFALAMREFQPLTHQPQPPGYPLFVALLKFLNLFIGSDQYVQLVAGVIGSLIALLLIRKLGDELFAPPAGRFALALLLFQPSFWLAGIGDPVRTFLAAGSLSVALCVWRAWTRPDTSRWTFLAGTALGVASGFRPELLILLLPLFCSILFCSIVFDRKLRPGVMLSATALLAAITSIWVGAILWKTGFLGLIHLCENQWSSATAHTTVLSGAPLHDNLRTTILATYWTGVGVVAWIAALPFAWRRMQWAAVRPQLLLLSCWLIPPYLFHALVFIHDPDTALDAIPAVTLLGGWVLARATEGRSPALLRVVAVGVMAVNAVIFFASPLREGKDASYAWVRMAGYGTSRAIDRIASAAKVGPTLVIDNRSLVTPRQIRYYFPDLPLWNIDADIRERCSGFNTARPQIPRAPLQIILLVPHDEELTITAPFRRDGNLATATWYRGQPLKIGACVWENPG